MRHNNYSDSIYSIFFKSFFLFLSGDDIVLPPPLTFHKGGRDRRGQHDSAGGGTIVRTGRTTSLGANVRLLYFE